MRATTKNRRGIDLFLLELIIVLLFFSISAAVILNMFSIADQKAEKCLVNEKLILCSQSVAEVFSAEGSLDKVTDRLFGGAYKSEPDGTRVVYTNKDFTAVNDPADASHTLRLKETRDEREYGVLSRLEYEFSEDGEVVFSGSSAAYIPDFEVNKHE